MGNLLRKAGTVCRLGVDEFVYRCWSDSLRPDIFILGGQKCGTSALASFLNRHPDVVGVRDKEAHFFHRDQVYLLGQAWYARQFPGRAAFRRNVRLFDATPIYLYHPATAERIREYCPKARLLVMLRNPVARAWSAYTMVRYEREYTREHVVRKFLLDANPEQRDPMVRLYYARQFPTFAEAVDQELREIESGDRTSLEPSFVRRGLYAEQLERYLNVFPREQIMILEDRELRNNREQVMGRVAEFLNLRPIAWKADELGDRNVRRYRQSPDPEVVARLTAFYRPHNELLFQLLGRRLDWESKA